MSKKINKQKNDNIKHRQEQRKNKLSNLNKIVEKKCK